MGLREIIKAFYLNPKLNLPKGIFIPFLRDIIFFCGNEYPFIFLTGNQKVQIIAFFKKRDYETINQQHFN